MEIRCVNPSPIPAILETYRYRKLWYSAWHIWSTQMSFILQHRTAETIKRLKRSYGLDPLAATKSIKDQPSNLQYVNLSSYVIKSAEIRHRDLYWRYILLILFLFVILIGWACMRLWRHRPNNNNTWKSALWRLRSIKFSRKFYNQSFYGICNHSNTSDECILSTLLLFWRLKMKATPSQQRRTIAIPRSMINGTIYYLPNYPQATQQQLGTFLFHLVMKVLYTTQSEWIKQCCGYEGWLTKIGWKQKEHLETWCSPANNAGI